jgi:tetratricopeptide (TPR) repeat protein
VNAEADSLTAQAYNARRNGDVERSIDAYRRAAELFADDGYPLREAHALRHVGDILRGQSKLEEALPYYERALALYETHSERADLDRGNALRGYALLIELLGRDAHPIWVQTREIYSAVGVEAGIAECDRHLGESESSGKTR